MMSSSQASSALSPGNASDSFVRTHVRSGQLMGFVQLGFVFVVILLAITLLRNETYVDSVSIWQDAALKAPGKWRVHYNLGNELKDLDRLQEAEQEWIRTIALFPGHAESLNQLGGVNFLRRDFVQAEHYYLRSLGIYQDNVEANYNLAMTEDQLGQPRQALKYYQLFLRMAPPSYHDEIVNAETRIDQLKRQVRE